MAHVRIFYNFAIRIRYSEVEAINEKILVDKGDAGVRRLEGDGVRGRRIRESFRGLY